MSNFVISILCRPRMKIAPLLLILAPRVCVAWAEEGPAGKPSGDGKPPPAVTPFDAAVAKRHQTAWAGYLRLVVPVPAIQRIWCWC